MPDACEGYGNLSRDEAVGILEAGLALMLVQRAPSQGYMPSSSLGQSVGAAAADNATALGYHQGCSLFCDLENNSPDASLDDVIDYCNAWWTAVDGAGFLPGLYVGPGSRMTTATLYSKLKFTSYWKSASKVPNVDTRGYQMLQSLSDNVHGIDVDFDIAAVDSKGGRPVWLAPPSEQARETQMTSRRAEAG